jgi:hypothetical protein
MKVNPSLQLEGHLGLLMDFYCAASAHFYMLKINQMWVFFQSAILFSEHSKFFSPYFSFFSGKSTEVVGFYCKISFSRRDKLTEEEIRDKFLSYWQKQRVRDPIYK